MPKIIILSNKYLCPKGKTIYCSNGDNLIDVLIKNKINIPHACGKIAACSTCYIKIHKGLDSLKKAKEKEEELLYNFGKYDFNYRLSCQINVKKKDLTIEIPEN